MHLVQHPQVHAIQENASFLPQENNTGLIFKFSDKNLNGSVEVERMAITLCAVVRDKNKFVVTDLKDVHERPLGRADGKSKIGRFAGHDHIRVTGDARDTTAFKTEISDILEKAPMQISTLRELHLYLGKDYIVEPRY